MVLEGSHKNEALKQGYGQTDVDAFCENDGPTARQIVEAAQQQRRELAREEREQIRWNSSGAYSHDAIAVREELEGRWLTAEYQMGDLLVFCMYLLHASSDNQTDCIRPVFRHALSAFTRANRRPLDRRRPARARHPRQAGHGVLIN